MPEVRHRRQRYRELPTDLTRSKNLRMHGVSIRENRKIPYSPVRLIPCQPGSRGGAPSTRGPCPKLSAGRISAGRRSGT